MIPILLCRRIATLLLVVISQISTGFIHSHHRRCLRPAVEVNRMCICIDCAMVTNCTSYHYVESKHGQPHMTEDPTFTPVDGSPTIHVNIRTGSAAAADQQHRRLWSEQVLAATDAVPSASTMTTYEYDVVACDSFVEEPGSWIKNMPQEIRQANPEFVPT